MIDIELTCKVNTKELYLLNQPFRLLKKEIDFIYGRISSYHNQDMNEPNWFKYYELSPPLEIVIGGSEDNITQAEMLEFITKNNGFSLSRNNLFAFYNLFNKRINEYMQKNKKSVSIVAPVHENLLPEHANGQKISPMIEIKYERERKTINYDWLFIDNPHTPIKNFAFFRHILDRSNEIY